MTLEHIIKEFKAEAIKLMQDRTNGYLSFKVNFSQGGIGSLEVDVHSHKKGRSRSNNR